VQSDDWNSMLERFDLREENLPTMEPLWTQADTETDMAPRTTPHEREVVLTVIWEYRSYTLEGSTERAPDWNRQRDDVWIRVAQTVGKKLAMKDYTVSRCKTILFESVKKMRTLGTLSYRYSRRTGGGVDPIVEEAIA
ncbi:hypothetical protein PFISCL1PPCAC_3569, partial [Pristionchus fissidentatus]